MQSAQPPRNAPVLKIYKGNWIMPVRFLVGVLPCDSSSSIQGMNLLHSRLLLSCVPARPAPTMPPLLVSWGGGEGREGGKVILSTRWVSLIC